MKRLTFFLSLIALAAVMFYSVSSASAQVRQQRANVGFGLIKNDYEKYANFFKNGREPSLSPSTEEGRAGNQTWRNYYRQHQWREYARENEYRDASPHAQTLVGIYLISEIDHRLLFQIDDIVISKAVLGPVLAEKFQLDLISTYIGRTDDPDVATLIEAAGEGDQFISPREQMRMEMLNRNIEEDVRRRVVASRDLIGRRNAEVRTFQNTFRHSEKGWEPTYYYIRENFNLLDELDAHFPFNWTTPEKRDAALAKLMENPEIIRKAEESVDAWVQGSRQRSSESSDGGRISSGRMMAVSEFGGMEGFEGMDTDALATLLSMQMGGTPQPTGPSEEQIAARMERELRNEAEKKMSDTEARYNAFRYIVGHYQSSSFFLKELEEVRNYFRATAAPPTNDPIAQYHLALFLKHLGDIVEPEISQSQRNSEIQELLAKARANDITRDRVIQLEEQAAVHSRSENVQRRAQKYKEKIDALIKLEEDKIDMYLAILIRVRENIGNFGGNMYGGNQGGTSGNRNTSGSRNIRTTNRSESSSYE